MNGFLQRLSELSTPTDHRVQRPFAHLQALGKPGMGQESTISRGQPEDETLEVLSAILLELRRQSRADFNNANPVDEWMSSATAPPASITINRQYDLPERIDSILASLPVGITAATLQLGQNILPLLSVGAPTTVQTVLNFTGMGIIINPSDQRVLTFTGAATSGFAIALMGHVLEREGSR